MNRRTGVKRIIPLGVHLMRGHLQLRHSGVRDFDASGVHFGIQHGFDPQAGLGPRGTDQIDDGLVAHERLALPIEADEREQPMFNLVPLAGPRGVVTDRDGDAQFVRQLLQVELPGPIATPIAAASIGTQQQARGFGIRSAPEQLPPSPQTLDRKLRCVVSHPDIDKPSVALQIIGPIRNGGPVAQRRKIIDIDHPGLALGTPRAPRIFELAHALLFFRVHRQHRGLASQELLHLRIEVLKLGIPSGGNTPTP